MSAPDAGLLLEAVDAVARHAGQVALRHFRAGIAVEHKPDGSPVTVADREAEQAAREWISARFPEDSITGEELDAARGRGSRRWIIDPIDGTRTFVRGVPLWGTLVAVCEGDQVLAGAACYPAVDETVAAAVGQGAWWNGVRARVSSVERMADAAAMTTDERFTFAPDRRDAWERLRAEVGIARSWGDCYGYLLVATGRADIMVDAILSEWDAAALFPIITEAGGVFTDWEGRPTSFGGSAIATNAALASATRTLLSGS